ncbi:SasC/FmtB family protein, partial [Staphylococcus epidermidis]|uniref:SasC/FmtB family protein n=6 Tax=Staphylococcus TaxID=1279 RepID=UPI0030BFEE6B
PKNYQAQGNVLVLGRAKASNTNDYGDFKGIEKEMTVNPNSEVVFEFNTMTTQNSQGGTNLVIKDADTDQELLNRLIQGGYL